MLIQYFMQYMKVTRGITDKSVRHYITGINSINTLLQKYDFPIKNVFECSSFSELDAIEAFLDSNTEFLEKDTVGHHMYSVAFRHFYNFAHADGDLFQNNISQMDIITAKPDMVTTSSKQWKRNQIVITQAIEGASYCCEYNTSHSTFIARSSGKAYMEGHHLIPLRFQPQFDCGIDVYANVVCLCPNCHRMMHFGRDSERKYAAEVFYDHRVERLRNSGIDLSKKDFLDLVIA